MDSLAHQQWNHFDKRSSSSSPFLFASPDGKAPSTARKVHLRRLRDILHLSIQRGDLLLARRTFGLLARCPEIEWTAIWKIGLVILATDSPPGGDNILGTTKHVEFLRVMMLQHPEEVRSVVPRPSHFPVSGGHGILFPLFNPTPPPRMSYCSRTFQRESLVQELVLSLAIAGRERDALDELELCGSPHFFVSLHTLDSKQCSYLPSPPYQDNSVLHTYAGLLCLRLAPTAETDMNTSAKGTCKRFHNKLVETDLTLYGIVGQSRVSSNQTLLREAKQHLERACALNPEGVVAQTFIQKVRSQSR